MMKNDVKEIKKSSFINFFSQKLECYNENILYKMYIYEFV